MVRNQLALNQCLEYFPGHYFVMALIHETAFQTAFQSLASGHPVLDLSQIRIQACVTFQLLSIIITHIVVINNYTHNPNNCTDHSCMDWAQAIAQQLVDLGSALLAMATAASPTAGSSLVACALNYIMSLTTSKEHVAAMGGLVQVCGVLFRTKNPKYYIDGCVLFRLT